MKKLSALVAFRHQNPIARFVSALAALAIAMLLVVVVVPTAEAADPCPTPGSFEIDGDMTLHTCTPAADDWNAPGLDVTATTQGGTYSTAGKDGGDTSTWVSSGSTPDKTNFERAYAAARNVDVGGGVLHYFVYVGWDRTDTAGTQGYAIEINGTAPRTGADGTPQPDRSAGSAVVYLSSVGSSAPTFDSACSFTSQSDYGDTCVSEENPNVVSAINTASFQDPLNHDTTQPAGSFFEVAIDVTGLTGITPSCPGAAANSVYLRSITGQTKNGNLKGYMAPLEVAPDSTCVAPPIDTTATPGGSQVARDSNQRDTVSVGTAEAPGVGTVKFFLCQPSDVTSGGCEGTAGTQVGGTVTLDSSGDGSSAIVNGATTPNDHASGTYCWRAEFTPGANDHHYLAGTHTNNDSECFTVVHASPSITTQIAVTGDNSPGLGYTTLGDIATLHDFVPGTVAGDTIDFNLYDVTADPGCTGTAVFHTTGTLNATGVATTSATYSPTAAHTYTWIASYGGDDFNDPVAGTCADAHESATVVGAHVDVTKSANPPGPVTAGTAIGFDITVSNAGSVPANDVTVTDNLPGEADGASSGDLNWSLSPAYTGCAITGAVGSQVLSCSLGRVDGSTTLPAIHVQSTTSPADCGVVSNKATVGTTNGTGEDSDIAHVTVQCPGLHIVKAADADSVSAGAPIGFTVTASNDGAGTATGVVVDDPLPTGPGITWTIDSSTGPLTCGIADDTLTCTGSLDAGASQVVHVTSPTEWSGSGESAINSCLGGPDEDGVYPNTAQVSASNVSQSPTAHAQTQVLCPDLHVTKTAGAATVNAGSPIGFTITASNTGAGDATGALVNDPLPGSVAWAIDTAGTSGPLDCTIESGTRTLSCTGTLAAGATETVHVTAATSTASCATYDNTVTLTATNTPQSPTASASTTVVCPQVIVSPPKPPQVSPPAVLPNTGGPDGRLVGAGVILLLGGGTLVAGDRRRRRRS